MFIHTRFAKFGWHKRTFCGKKEEELLAKSSQTGYNRSLCVNFVNCVKQKNILYMSCCWDASCNEFIWSQDKIILKERVVFNWCDRGIWG